LGGYCGGGLIKRQKRDTQYGVWVIIHFFFPSKAVFTLSPLPESSEKPVTFRNSNSDSNFKILNEKACDPLNFYNDHVRRLILDLTAKNEQPTILLEELQKYYCNRPKLRVSLPEIKLYL
jgi:hypothetical protein